MILCFGVPAWFYQATGGLTNDRNPWWSAGVIVFAGLAYAGVIASKRRQLYSMVVWLFTYLFMGLAPYVQYRLDTMPGTTPQVDTSLLPITSGLIIASGIAYLVGGHFARGRHSIAPTAFRVSRRKANILTVITIGLFAYYAAQVGPSSYFLSRTEFMMVKQMTWPNPTVLALLTGAMTMGLLVAFLAQMTVRHQLKAARIRPPVLPAVVVAGLLLFISNPISSPRSAVGNLMLSMIAAFGAYATVTRFRVVCAAALMGMLTIFPLADLFRHSTDATFKAESPVTALTSGDFDAFTQVVNSLDYVSMQGITWGQQLLGVLMLWVPRSLWPGKPEDTGIVLAEYMGYQFTNISAPFWAEMTINFGLLGAIVGMGVLGYWFQILDSRTDLHLRFHAMPPVVVCATAFYMLVFLRGSMLAVSAYLLVILLASWFVTERRRTSPVHFRAMSSPTPERVM